MKHNIADLVQTIDWKKGMNSNELIGYVNGRIMFIIDRKGIRTITYTLKSFPFHNDVFARANNYKKLSVVPETELEKLKAYAQNSFNIFVKQFLNLNVS